MLRALAILIAFAISVAACGFGSDVGHSGEYAIDPRTRVTDSAFYPLRSYLVVEQDANVRQLRIYLFTGNLRRADLGLEDLRRIAQRFGRFSMSFDVPEERVETADGLDAGMEDADAGPIFGHGQPIDARLDERPLSLVRLDDKGLFRSGASRYLTALRTSEYAVDAYFAVADASESLPEISIDSLGIRFAIALDSAEPELVQTDALLGFSYRTRADYLLFELSQTQRRKADKSRVDALVQTWLAAGSAYGLSPTLLTDVASQGCWSSDRPVDARVHQFLRSYQQRPSAAGGDWAVSYTRTEVLSIPSSTWTALLQEPRRPSYCDSFE